MAAPRKYDDLTRREIDRLCNLEGKKAPEAARLIASGMTEAPAQTIPATTIRLLAREQRTDITERPKAEQLRQLTGLAVRVIHDGFARAQAKPDQADADETLKLVRSLRELEPLLTDKPAGKGQDKPETLLGGLSVVANTSEQANTEAAVTAPVSAREAS